MKQILVALLLAMTARAELVEILEPSRLPAYPAPHDVAAGTVVRLVSLYGPPTILATLHRSALDREVQLRAGDTILGPATFIVPAAAGILLDVTELVTVQASTNLVDWSPVITLQVSSTNATTVFRAK